jgi:formate-dependent phosphoribosylglycinamide formyltransferase (GAR transformylase)
VLAFRRVAVTLARGDSVEAARAKARAAAAALQVSLHEDGDGV